MRFLIASFLLFLLCHVYGQESKDQLYLGVYKLVMADEFNDSALNTGIWFTYYPYTDDGSDQCSFCRTHGKEAQIYLDSNLVIRDGVLNIIAKREQAEWFGEERQYTSGMIHSKQVFGRGRYEIRAKLPAGEGFSPAIWTFGHIYSEIDILEAGMLKPRRFHVTVHNWIMKKMIHKRITTKTDISDDFHVYAMEWDSTSIRFFIDDQQVWTLCKYSRRNGRNPKTCNQKRHYKIQPIFPADDEKISLIIGLGIGNDISAFSGPPGENTKFPNAMLVDYVRIYQELSE